MITVQRPSSGPKSPKNTVVVNVKEHFPDPVAGTITLEANTIYEIGDDVSIGADNLNISAGGIIIRGNAFSNTLTYTGTQSMLVGDKTSFILSNLNIDAPNATVIEVEDTTTTNVSEIIIEAVVVKNCAKYLKATNVLAVNIKNSRCLNSTQGIELFGNIVVVSITELALISSSVTFIGVNFGTAVLNGVTINTFTFGGPSGSIGISGAANSANISVNNIARVLGGLFISGLTPLSVIDRNDIRWRFADNSGIQNTEKNGMLTLNNNTTETVISVIDTPVLVAGTWVVEDENFFTGTTSGRLTHIGETISSYSIDVSSSLLLASGSGDNSTVYIAIDGAIVQDSGRTIELSSASSSSVSLHWQVSMSLNQYVELHVENNSTTRNIIVISSVILIRNGG